MHVQLVAAIWNIERLLQYPNPVPKPTERLDTGNERDGSSDRVLLAALERVEELAPGCGC